MELLIKLEMTREATQVSTELKIAGMGENKSTAPYS